ncbi:MAG: hypothetical protein HQM03_01180 [Magnetococcales bacterium]|nr:hypothetical protein [Magnetococcales bacterium]
MTTKPIIESDMTFGPYPDGLCWVIEKSNTYKKIEQGVQMAEFLLLRTNRNKSPVLWVVEAKKSSPRPETQPNFDDFIRAIHEKLVNAFSLSFASCMNRHQPTFSELPKFYKNLDLSKIEVKFILVINGHQEDWLPPIQVALKEALHTTIKTWSLSPNSVAVLNDMQAREHGLIQ